MPSLAVLSQSLRTPGGELGRVRRCEVQLPRAADPVAELLAGLGVAKHSLVDITVPEVRLLRAEQALAGVAGDWAVRNWPSEAAPGEPDAVQESMLRLAAVSRGDGGCVAPPSDGGCADAARPQL